MGAADYVTSENAELEKPQDMAALLYCCPSPDPLKCHPIKYHQEQLDATVISHTKYFTSSITGEILAGNASSFPHNVCVQGALF